MKLPPFEYRRAATVEEALAALDEVGDEGKLLAGGQSLLPAMAFRLVRPAALVDVDRVDGLDRLEMDDGRLRMGALVRHAAIERDTRLAGPWAALREAAAHVGHYPVRVRGTFGGSIAHADPAAEFGVVAAALGAEVVARSSSGERVIPVDELFLAPYTTALAANEMLVEVRFPRPPAGAVSIFEELAERAGDYALASVCVALAADNRRVAWVRIALGSVGATPVRAADAERVLEGAEGENEAVEEAARAAARECDPGSDAHADADYRRELVAILTRRALRRALA